jgi:hypothetical protein
MRAGASQTLRARLLDAYASMRAPALVRAVIGVLVLSVVVVDLVVRAALLPLGWLLRPTRAPPDVTRCPNDHIVDLVGWYVCPSCAAVTYCHAWEPCCVCRSAAGSTVFCACGAAIGAPEHFREEA